MSPSDQLQQPSDAEAQVDQQSNILAELCAAAPTDAVRNCLRKYDAKNTTWQNERELKKFKKEILVATLDYLELPDMNQ